MNTASPYFELAADLVRIQAAALTSPERREYVVLVRSWRDQVDAGLRAIAAARLASDRAQRILEDAKLTDDQLRFLEQQTGWKRTGVK